MEKGAFKRLGNEKKWMILLDPFDNNNIGKTVNEEGFIRIRAAFRIGMEKVNRGLDTKEDFLDLLGLVIRVGREVETNKLMEVDESILDEKDENGKMELGNDEEKPAESEEQSTKTEEEDIKKPDSSRSRSKEK